ncbi:MAG: hypothetical protein RL417_845 [Pseudomonadota bacterium]|jgi:GT2 family glycosyltransferase
MTHPSVFAHIVTFNNAATIGRCLDGLFAQSGFTPGENLTVLITDNASTDGTVDRIRAQSNLRLTLDTLSENTGFCAGHNRGVARFLESEMKYLLILNPDLRLEASALAELVGALEGDANAGIACPKLLRADERLDPVQPRRLDGAGMHLTTALRHFDRGSDELDTGQYDRPAYVFGGSGACLLLRRDAVKALLVDSAPADETLHGIYPFLRAPGRAPLFDEAFFAYREDADLAWRGQTLGIQCRYVPLAAGYHKRVVTPDRRGTLPALLNRLSVRNRFLLQANNFVPTASLAASLNGAVVRNLLVLLALPLRERASIPGVIEALRLFGRALYRRRIIFERAREPAKRVARWFTVSEEPCLFS